MFFVAEFDPTLNKDYLILFCNGKIELIYIQ